MHTKYVRKIEALIHSFKTLNSADCRCKSLQIPLLFQMSPDYQLELIDLQSSDAMRAAYRDKTVTLPDFCNSLPATFANPKDNAPVQFMQACLEAPNIHFTDEAEQT
jgi:hypothetical protein